MSLKACLLQGGLAISHPWGIHLSEGATGVARYVSRAALERPGFLEIFLDHVLESSTMSDNLLHNFTLV